MQVIKDALFNHQTLSPQLSQAAAGPTVMETSI